MKYLKTYESLKGITFKQWLKMCPHKINTTEIDCSNANLIDLNGIEIFTNLEDLYCDNNQLTSLPDLPSKLKNLSCYNNKLTSLPEELPSNLKFLDCDDNKLTSLPDLPSKLETLYCYNNKLTELPDLSNLKYLNCWNNNLPYTNLTEYLEWHKTNYPDIWSAKKYNI